MKPFAALSAVVLLALSASAAPSHVILITDPQPGRATHYALGKVREALQAKGVPVDDPSARVSGKSWTLTATLNSPATISGTNTSPAAESFAIFWLPNAGASPTIMVQGADDRGLMYALLDIADRIAWSTNASDPFSDVRETRESPDVRDRALSIYTFHRATFEQRFFDEKYWARYFDMLARDRFNNFVLIFGYENGGYFTPVYPWFFDVDGFAGISVPNVTGAQQARNLAALNRLIEMAHDRGLRFNVGLWDHIYRGGVQSGGMADADPNTPGPDRVWGLNQTNLFAYSQAGLAKFLKLVPGIDAVQFRMHDESGLKPGEEQYQFWKSMFGVIKQERPDLPLTLRAKGLPDEIIDLGLGMGLNIRVATKYWMEQVGLPFHPTHIVAQDQANRRHGYADLLRYPQRYKMQWRLWTAGTIRVLLWGDPEYARRFAQSTHLYDGDGFEVTEPLGTKMQGQPHAQKPFDLMKPQYRYYDYEFERYWHFYQVFGRMAYSSNTPPEIWDREFARRFGRDAGPLLETALHRASWILPRINASVFPYRNFPTTRGWAEKQRWGDLAEYAKEAQASDTQLFQGIDEAARNQVDGIESAKLSPAANSQWFAETARAILDAVGQAEKQIATRRSPEFRSTIVDLKILAHLAGYHSHRILAGLNYALFTHTRDVNRLNQAIAEEENAVSEWTALVDAAGDVYVDNFLMGRVSVGLCGHWRDELKLLRTDLADLKQQEKEARVEWPKPIASVRPPSTSPDHEPPSLFNTSMTTTAPGRPLLLTAVAKDPSGIKWIRARYRAVNQTQDYRTLEMHPTGPKNAYGAVVPGEEIDGKWDLMYFFEVMDNAGNGKIYPDFEKETPYVVVRLNR
jgi:hypothetical protein